MFFTPNLVVGLTVMVVGVVLLLDTLGIQDAGNLLKYWPGIVVLFGASLVAQAIKPADPAVRRANGGVPCFFLFLLGVAMFASFGTWGTTSASGPTASVAGIMGRGEALGIGPDVRRGRVASVMGRSTLDLLQVTIAPGEEFVVEVFVAMGRATVRIPDDWVVDTGAVSVMGSIDQARFKPLPLPAEAEEPAEQNPPPAVETPPVPPSPPPPPAAAPGSTPAAGSPRLVLRGVVVMGKVEVTS